MKFTIEEIKKYLESQDSFGDIFYNLSKENIIKANKVEEDDAEELIIKIISCQQCLHFRLGRDYSLDGFDRGNDWFCDKNESKKIVSFVEKPSEAKTIRIPEWCPLKQ